MENFTVLKKLGKGAQGAVFLVTDKRDEKQYVLKKVECNDEGEANKAFREAMALEQLTHPYVCGYREFFVEWDKVEETMYVCILMEFYETGDLDNILKQYRAKENHLPEKLLMKWFGQMVEALCFVHGQKIIHRDLKPSNIFMTTDLDICIGDFGVATIMNDARTRTRTTVGTMNWMAPEVLERPYDERSDVWSLGCILLAATTCGFMDHPQCQAALFELKHSQQRLEEVLQEVQKKYSKDLCQTIRTMLRRKFQQRPTAEDLTRLPFVRSCLELSKSELVEGERQRAAVESTVKPTTTKRIPTKVEELLGFLEANVARAGCQVMGLEQLLKLIAENAEVPGDVVVERVLAAMAAHEDNHWVQASACSALRVVASNDTIQAESVHTEPTVSAVVFAMRSHPGSIVLQTEASLLLKELAASEATALLVGKAGGLQDVLTALRQNADNADVARACCSALCALAICEDNSQIVTEEQGIQDVAQAMNGHEDNPDVLEAACAALWSLSAEDENVDLIYDLGCVSLMVKALVTHCKVASLVKQAAIALASLAVDAECAECIVETDDGTDGIAATLQAFELHNSNPDVLENLLTLISELAEHEDVREALVELGCTELLTRTAIQMEANPKMVDTCNGALKVLSGQA